MLTEILICEVQLKLHKIFPDYLTQKLQMVAQNPALSVKKKNLQISKREISHVILDFQFCLKYHQAFCDYTCLIRTHPSFLIPVAL